MNKKKTKLRDESLCFKIKSQNQGLKKVRTLRQSWNLN